MTTRGERTLTELYDAATGLGFQFSFPSTGEIALEYPQVTQPAASACQVRAVVGAVNRRRGISRRW
jgi:hypothetical protein